VTVTLTGEPRPLPAVTDVSAFRIIQEALTNSLRHAGPATASVSVNYADEALLIEVTDTGRGPGNAGPASRPAHAAAGHGIRGMRERAAAAGGTIQIGPGPAGGFRVAAQLPTSTPLPDATPTPAAQEVTR